MSYFFDGIDGYLRENVGTGMPAIVVSVAEYGDKQFGPPLGELYSLAQLLLVTRCGSPSPNVTLKTGSIQMEHKK